MSQVGAQLQFHNGVPLPVREGPLNGTFAFDEDGEQLIFDAIHTHHLRKIVVAGLVEISLPTLDAILRRVEERLSAKESIPAHEEPGSPQSEADVQRSDCTPGGRS